MEDGAPPDYCDFDDLLLQMSEKRTLLIKQPCRNDTRLSIDRYARFGRGTVTYIYT